MDINISKRAFVRIVTFCVAVVLCLGVALFATRSKLKASEREAEHIYLNAVEELSTNINSISNTLNKAMYCGTSHQLSYLSSKLWRDASVAKQALSSLPIEEVELENIYRFLSQVGNYAVAISEKSADGNTLSQNEYNTFLKLHEYSQKLSQEIYHIDNRLNSGTLSLKKTKEYLSPQNIAPPTLADGLEQFESTTENFPKLIYDGPFSDHIIEQNPKMLMDVGEITLDQAKEIAQKFTKTELDEIKQLPDENGKMSSYRFETSKGIVSVTKKGGYISYLLGSRFVENATLNINDALAVANAFIQTSGNTKMITTYYETVNNICTINFAYAQDDVVVYTDLIKVSVALDNGEVVGFDARGYLVNHSQREFPQNILTKDDAQKSVSKMLSVEKSKLAFIPNNCGGEVLTYEFSCTAENGQTILVYINAQNAKEEQILVVYNQGDSVLTM